MMGTKSATAFADAATQASVRELRRRANAALKHLSPEQLQFAVAFLEFLRERDEWEATMDILTDPQMMAMIRKAEKRWRTKGKEAFVPWEEAKRILK